MRITLTYIIKGIRLRFRFHNPRKLRRTKDREIMLVTNGGFVTGRLQEIGKGQIRIQRKDSSTQWIAEADVHGWISSPGKFIDGILAGTTIADLADSRNFNTQCHTEQTSPSPTHGRP